MPNTDFTDDAASTFQTGCCCSRAELDLDFPEVAVSEVERANHPNSAVRPAERLMTMDVQPACRRFRESRDQFEIDTAEAKVKSLRKKRTGPSKEGR